MKTKNVFTLLALTALLTGLLIYFILINKTCSCSNNNSNEKVVAVDKEKIIESFVNSRHSLTMQETKDLYQNYKTRFIPVISKIQNDPALGIKRNNYQPTESSLVPLQKLKDYIAFLDVLQEKNPEQIISGVAISFGAYNLDVEFNDKRESTDFKDPPKIGDYRGKLGVVLTPTYYDSSLSNTNSDAEKHIPFYISYNNESDKFTGTFEPLNKYLDAENKNTRSLRSTMVASSENSQSVSCNEFTDIPSRSLR